MESKAEDKKIRILDILEQIEKLNLLIQVHTQETKSALLVEQYTTLRQQFINELKTILSDFQLTVDMV